MSKKSEREEREREVERELDRQLEDTFPASDALKIVLGRVENHAPPDKPSRKRKQAD